MSMDHIPLVGFLFSLKRLLPLSSSVLAYCSNFCLFGVHSVATLPKHSWWILPWWKPWWRTVQMCVMKHLKAHSRHSKNGWDDNAQDGSLFFSLTGYLPQDCKIYCEMGYEKKYNPQWKHDLWWVFLGLWIKGEYERLATPLFLRKSWRTGCILHLCSIEKAWEINIGNKYLRVFFFLIWKAGPKYKWEADSLVLLIWIVFWRWFLSWFWVKPRTIVCKVSWEVLFRGRQCVITLSVIMKRYKKNLLPPYQEGGSSHGLGIL